MMSKIHGSLIQSPYPYRRTFIGVESFVAIGGLAGAWQLWTGTYAPPVSDLQALGLDSWRLPAVWLFVSVAAPSTAAAIAGLRRWPLAPTVVLVASGLLLVEVAVQIPFVGPSALQAVFGAVGIGLGTLAWLARRSGRWAPVNEIHPVAATFTHSE